MNDNGTQPKATVLADDELVFKKMFSALWAGKFIIIGTTVIISGLAVWLALSLPNVYRSETLLTPVSQEKRGLGGLSSSLGGLASLAGVNFGGGETNKTEIALETLKSRQFFRDFNDKYSVILPLMAAKDWDAINDKLIYDDEVYNEKNNTWLLPSKNGQGEPPTVQQAHREFLKLLKVETDKQTGFVKVAIEFFSPNIAKQWVDWLVDDINETIKNQDVEQAQKSIDYLTEQINQTQLTDLQRGFFEMIQAQTKTIMLANASPEYLFKTLDPAVAPERKVGPKRAIICILGGLVGGILGVLIVLVRYLLSSEDE